MPEAGNGWSAAPWSRTHTTYALLLLAWFLAVLVVGGIALQWSHGQAERRFVSQFQQLTRDLDVAFRVNAALLEGSVALVNAHDRYSSPALGNQIRGLLQRFPRVRALRVYAMDGNGDHAALAVSGVNADAPAGAPAQAAALEAAFRLALDSGEVVASVPFPDSDNNGVYALFRSLSGETRAAAVALFVELPASVAEHTPPACKYRLALIHERAPSSLGDGVLFERVESPSGPRDAMTLRELRQVHRFSAAGQPFRLEAECGLGWNAVDGGLALGIGVGSAGGLLLALLTAGAIVHRRSGRENARLRLFYLANFDTVTGLPNRNLLLDRLGQGIARAQRSGKGLVLLYLDMDGFKAVNDTAGHEAGDLVLREIAERLSGVVREQDTVARLSGDEFVVILEGLDPLDMAPVVVRKIQDVVAVPFHVQGLTFLLGVSVGIACYPSDGATATELLHHADLSMYAVKHPVSRSAR